MTDSTDHVTGKTGLTLTITASKDGAAFASISPTVTELASGWYSLALTTTHTNTAGDLVLHVTSSGADPTDLVLQVVAYDPTDTVRLGLTSLPNAAADATGGLPILTGTTLAYTVSTVTTLTNLPSATTDWVTAASVSAAAVTKIQAGLSTYAGGAVASVTGNVGGNVAGNVVGTVASVVGAVGSVTAAVTLDTTQAIPTTNTAQTVGDALNAARAQGFGKWAISGTTLTLYAGNGSTVVRTFTLDSATSPTSRT